MGINDKYIYTQNVTITITNNNKMETFVFVQHKGYR